MPNIYLKNLEVTTTPTEETMIPMDIMQYSDD